MWKTLIGQIRLRRYRPFVVERKSVPSKVKENVASSSSQVGGSTKSGETQTPVQPTLFQVGPLQAMKLLTAFSPISTTTTGPIQYITLSLTLDVDTKRQSVRGICQLPHGLKTDSKIAVFCSDFDAQEMLDAGADFAGMTELLQRIGKGWVGFDRCIATPAVMPQVMKVAKVLGPRKLMPNPKSGTLVTDLKRAIAEAKSGAQIEYRTGETEPVVTVRIGSIDAPLAHNLENMKFFVREILKQRNRQTTGVESADSGAGRLVTLGGISMLPDPALLNRLLGKNNLKKSEKSASKGLFIQSATIQAMGLPVVDLSPELVLPSSPAYYR